MHKHRQMPLQMRSCAKGAVLSHHQAQPRHLSTLRPPLQVVGYDALMAHLELPTVRALEDFIIQHCIYPGLLKCQLDQRHRRVHVQDVYSRDVPPAQLPQLTQGLQALCAPARSSAAY